MTTTATNVYEISNTQYHNPLAAVITDYQMAEEVETNKWQDAIGLAIAGGFDTKEQWEAYYLEAEEEQVCAREQLGEVIKRTQAGKIVARRAFPSTWNTDKAIIGKALDEGVPLVDSDGNVKAKGQLQDEYKAEHEATLVEKTAFEKIKAPINAYKALFKELTPEQQESILAEMNAFHDTVV